MSSFVLVHGSWHGAWCWTRLVPMLEAAGHTVVAIDLPGHGDDETPHSEVTLDSYSTRICDVVREQPGPVVLVGHSMGGGAITQAVEHCASEVGLLVYLSAFVPPHGTSIAEQALVDESSLLTGAVHIDSEKGVASLEQSAIDACFYADCSSDDIAFARARLCDDPLAPLTTPLSLGCEGAHGLPRVYIECLRDTAVTPTHQRGIRADRDWAHVFTLDTSHSPFLSAPRQLADLLLASVDFAR